jgi:hypothetical protein
MRSYSPLYFRKESFFNFGSKVVEVVFIVSTIFCIVISTSGNAQESNRSKFVAGLNHDLYGVQSAFVENVGQYGEEVEGYSAMGRIIYGYEGLDMPVLFTSKGIIYLQRKVEGKTPEERELEEAREKKELPEEDFTQHTNVNDRVITMEWLDANPQPQIILEDSLYAYHTYGWLQEKAHLFGRVIYKNLYPGIDLVYSFSKKDKSGFEYSFIVSPNADVSKIAFRFGGNVKKVKRSGTNELHVYSDINSIIQSVPVVYYGNAITTTPANLIQAEYQIAKRTVRINFPMNYDASKSIVIDPFVTSAANLTGANAGKAKDVDFDYNGNVFVTGGGDGSIYKLAKYDPNGVLQWTFSGALAVPAWTFGTYYGGWVVEKNTGNTYLGQGFAPGVGFRVIRLNAAGVYDNYISTGNVNFQENWKMLWSCNNGSPQILVAGGGTNSNINVGILAPPSTTVTALNVTGIVNVGTNGWAQDICDMIIDPANNDMYTVYGSLIGTPSITNMMYKNPAPYSNTSIAWTAPTGFTTLQEIANRPYLAGPQIDNSCNAFAVNSSYFFFWDGKNLKAYNKLTGAGIGTPLVTANTALMQGGIIADECNNIFVGSVNGTIKVYKFNGSIFDDAAQPDIAIPGFGAASTYDLVLNEAQKLLYASGNGFVTSIDISSYGCLNAVYSVTVNSDCVNLSATAILSPAPPVGSTVTYILYNGATQVASNSTGVFTSLLANVNYSVHAIVNQSCSGTQSLANFIIAAPNLSFTKTDPTCGNLTGAINATGTGGAGGLTYSINGINFQASGSFVGLGAGVYTLIVKDANGCRNTAVVNLINSNGPSVAITKTDAACGLANGTVTSNGSGGTAPYTYSIGGPFQASTNFTGLSAGVYTVTVKDATGCLNSGNITLNNIGVTSITSSTVNASCGNSNGSITANVTGGVGPYVYSLNAINFTVNNVFTGLAAGSYTLTVKDANNCINSLPVTISNVAAPVVTALAVPTNCNSFTGTVTISVAGGTAPFQYSINNGVSFQGSGFFPGLQAGSYPIVVKDGNGCTTTTSVVVNLSIPQVTDSSVASSCSGSDGAIYAIGTGGSTPYTFSINGTVFQTSNLFSGLSAGTYTLIIKDANGCTNSISPVTVNNASGLTINTTSTISSCTVANGTITAIASGGTGALQYSINGINFQAGNVFSNLAAGSYTVTVKDVNGCISQSHVSVLSLPLPSVTAVTTNTSCNSSNGTISLSGIGGTPSYTYSINGVNFFASNVFTGLLSGLYNVTIRDVNGCSATAQAVISNVGGGSGPVVTATTVNAECGQSNGRINANATGGQNPTRYSIDGITFQNSSTFNNVPPGTYTVFARDANGCISTVVVTVGNFLGPQVTATTTSTLCGSSTGSIVATGFGGVAPYKFSIDGGNTFINGTTFSGLSAGFYTLIVRDAANVCRNSITVNIANSNGPVVTPNKTDANCGTNNGTITVTTSGGVAPITYSINGVNFQNSNIFSGLTPGQYAVSAKDATGCVNVSTITVGTVAMPTVAASLIPEACGLANGSITLTGSNGVSPYQYSINGISFQSPNTFTGLSAGPYTVTMRDANGCTVSSNVTVSALTGAQLTLASTAACAPNSGKIIVTGTGGTLPYSYSLNNIVFQSSFIFTNLAIGPYTVTIRDANNCKTNATINVTPASPPSVTATVVPSGCSTNDGSITAIPSGGTGPYQYSIDGISFQASPIFSALPVGVYTLTILDANGCTNSTTVAITLTSGTTLIWTGAVNTDWQNVNNWGGCQIPDCRYNVTIPSLPVNQPVISSVDASCRSITINSGAHLTLNANRQLMVCSNYMNNGVFTAGASSTVLIQDTCLGCAGGINHNQLLDGSIVNANKFWNMTVTKTTGTAAIANQNIDMAGNFTTTNANSIFNSNSKYIKLAGNFLNASGAATYINAAPTGTLEFNGTSLQNYTPNGFLDLENVVINNAGGGVNLVGNDISLNTTGVLTLQLGNIITGAFEAKVKNNSPTAIVGGSVTSFVQGNLRRALNGTAASYDFPVGHALKGYQKANVSFTTATTIPELVANFQTYSSALIGPVSNDCMSFDYSILPVLDNGFWNITASANSTSGNYDITLFNNNFTATGLYTTVVTSPISPPTNLSWQLNGVCNLSSIPAQTKRDGLNGFSSFGTGVANSPLPIELLSFTGSKSGEINVLHWVTAAEINNDYFTLEHSSDGIHFSEIAKLTGAGNSTSELSYTSDDLHPFFDLTYYRLKQTDFDGKFTYSNTIVISNKSVRSLVSITPNPAHGNIQLNYLNQFDQELNVHVFNLLGEELLNEKYFMPKGKEQLNLRLETLATGTYFLKVEDNFDHLVFSSVFVEM